MAFFQDTRQTKVLPVAHTCSPSISEKESGDKQIWWGGGLLASQPSLEQSFSSVRNPVSHKMVKVPVVVSFANFTQIRIV